MTRPPPPPRDEREYWFAWQRNELGFRARPIHWKGWASFLALVAFMTLAPWVPALWIAPWPPAGDPALPLAIMVAALAIGMMLLFRLIKATGRPARPG
jgi:hypothetical protein